MFYSISRKPTLRIAKIEGIAYIQHCDRIQGVPSFQMSTKIVQPITLTDYKINRTRNLILSLFSVSDFFIPSGKIVHTKQMMKHAFLVFFKLQGKQILIIIISLVSK